MADPGPFRPYLRELYMLRALVAQLPTPVVDTLAQARYCGRAAFHVGIPIEDVVEEVAGVVPDAGYRLGDFPADIVEAAVEGYLTAFDARNHVLRAG